MGHRTVAKGPHRFPENVTQDSARPAWVPASCRLVLRLVAEAVPVQTEACQTRTPQKGFGKNKPGFRESARKPGALPERGQQPFQSCRVPTKFRLAHRDLTSLLTARRESSGLPSVLAALLQPPPVLVKGRTETFPEKDWGERGIPPLNLVGVADEPAHPLDEPPAVRRPRS